MAYMLYTLLGLTFNLISLTFSKVCIHVIISILWKVSFITIFLSSSIDYGNYNCKHELPAWPRMRNLNCHQLSCSGVGLLSCLNKQWGLCLGGHIEFVSRKFHLAERAVCHHASNYFCVNNVAAIFIIVIKLIPTFLILFTFDFY